MKYVFLSGGNGVRLWPLSNQNRAKQFLPLLSSPDEGMESMVQRVLRQMKGVGMIQDMFIAINEYQVGIFLNQTRFERKRVFVEPSRKDTFYAIIHSCLCLLEHHDCHPDEVIAVMPIDMHVGNDYFQVIKQLGDLIQQDTAPLGLIGIEPTFPSTAYGYLTTHKQISNNAYRLKKFQEKPTYEKAWELVEEGAFWNAGVFVFKISYILQKAKEKNIPITLSEFLNEFDQYQPNSFDYEVAEKEKNAIVVTYKGDWKDLGTWEQLSMHMASPFIGKGKIINSNTSYGVNELGIPLILHELENVFVAASPEGILVTSMESSHLVKQHVEGIHERLMFEERLWGNYRIIDMQENDICTTLTKRLLVKTGKNLSYQYHQYRKEVWTVIKGKGLFILNEQMREVGIGSVIQIPLGARHSIKALEEMEIIEVQIGTKLIEEDIVRITYQWNEMEAMLKKEENNG